MSEDDARARIAAQASDEQTASGRRRVAGQLRVSRANWWNAPESCGTSASFRSRTTCGSIVRSLHRRLGAGRPDMAGSGAPHRRAAEDGLRAQRAAGGPHRLDRGARVGRQGCHRRTGHGRHRWRSPTRSPKRSCTPATHASSRITADVAKPDARSTVTDFDHTDDPALWHKRIHASADPGRPTHVHVRVDGWPNQQFALLFTDWLIATPSRAGGLSRRQTGGRRRRRDYARGQGAVVPRRVPAGVGVGGCGELASLTRRAAAVHRLGVHLRT